MFWQQDSRSPPKTCKIFWIRVLKVALRFYYRYTMLMARLLSFVFFQGLSQDPNSLSNLDQVRFSFFLSGVITVVSNTEQCRISRLKVNQKRATAAQFEHNWKKKLVLPWRNSKVLLVSLVVCYLNFTVLTFNRVYSFRICPTTWFIKFPSGPYLRSGFGVKRGVMMNPKAELKLLTWYGSQTNLFNFYRPS